MKKEEWLEEEAEDESLKKYAFWVIIAILIIVSFFIIRSYIVSLITAFILAYLIKPIYTALSKKIPKPLSAILCIIIITIVIIIPLIALVGSLANIAYSSVSLEGLSALQREISSLPFLENINLDVLNDRISAILVSIASSTLRQIPSIALAVFVTILGIYFMLISWDEIVGKLKRYLPFKEKARVASEIGKTTHAIIYGYFLISIIEFVIAYLGFSISGVDNALIYATLIGIFAFLPGVGPGAVWVLVALFQIIAQDYLSTIGIIITGLIISIGIDTFLVLKIIGARARIHPLILLVGILGGVPLFGIFGFIIGPLILIYSLKIMDETFR